MAAELGLVALWLVLVVALGGVALPFASLLFPRFADRGAGLAVPLALAVLGIVGYWVGRFAFGVVAAVVGVLVLAALSALALRRGVRVRWRRYAEAVGVFAVGFGFVLVVRAADPGVVAIGGEKFLDYGLLNSLYRTETLPPEDPWFAAERVRYYYGGYLVTALLGRLVGTPSAYAYNLALAVIYGATVSGAYGLAGSIADHDGAGRVRAGLFAAFFVGFASNLATPVRFLAGVVPGGHRVASFFGVPLERGGGETVAHGTESFGYWDASRIIDGTINEFPLFGFLNGDLHPHMLSLPFLLLAAGVLFSYWQTPAGAVGRRRLTVLAAALLAGWLAVVNSWDAPTAMGLTWLALALAPATPWSLLPRRVADPLAARLERRIATAEAARPLVAAGIAGAVGAVAVASVLPYVVGVTATGGRTVEFVAERSDPVALALVHGAFLFVALWYVSRRFETGPAAIRNETVAVAGLLGVLLWTLELAAFALVAPLILAGWYLVRSDRGGFETLLFVAGAGLVVTAELVYLADGTGSGRLNTVFKTYVHVWVFWSVAAGVALSTLVDRRRVADGRLEVERRAGTASSATSARPDGSGRGEDEGDGGGNEDGNGDGSEGGNGRPTAGSDGDSPTAFGRRRAVAVALALVLGLSLYGGLALADHFEGDDAWTLDARHDVRTDAPDEAAAFAWLDDRAGQPRIVEGATPARHTYGSSDAAGRWPPSTYVNGASTFTGLPTIVGWTHSSYYHGDEAYEERVADVETVYTGSEAERAAVLERYEIAYVYVGPNERAWYHLADLAADDALEEAATFGEVTIYEVDQSELSA